MNKSKKITYTALLIAFGVILPQALHIIGGQSLGGVFLPIQLPIFISAILIGFSSSISIAIILPILSFLLTAMPSAIKLPFMIIELCLYAIFFKLLNGKRLYLVIKIALTQFFGRLSLLIIYIMLNQLNIAGALSLSLAIDTFILAIPGIIIQLIILPIIIKLLRRG